MSARLLTIALLFAAPAVLAQRQSDPAEIARSFFLAHTAGRTDQAVAFWKAGPAAAYRTRAMRTASARCFVIRELTVRVVSDARVEIDAEAVTWSSLPGALPAGRSMFVAIELEDGTIVAFRDREEILADEIFAADASRRAELARSAGRLRTPLLASLLSRKSIVLMNLRRIADAAQVARLAMEIAGETGDAAAEAESLSAWAWALERHHRLLPVEVLPMRQEAVEIAARAGDPDAFARTLLRLGRAENELSAAPSGERFEQMVALGDSVEDASVIGHAHTQLASVADQEGRHRDAFRHSLLVGQYAEQTGDVAVRLSAALNLGGAFHEQSDTELARQYFERAAAIAAEAGFDGSRASALHRLAKLELSAGEVDRALANLEEILAVTARIGDADSYCEALLSRAGHYLDQCGDVAAAERDLEAAEAKRPFTTVGVQRSLTAFRATLLLRQGRCEEALQLSPDLVEALWCLGRREEAAAVALDKLQALERLRAGSSAETQQLHAWQEGVSHNFATTAGYLLQVGRTGEALLVADRPKARMLADARAALLVRTDRLTGSDREAYDRLNARIHSLNREILDAAAKGNETAHLQQQLERVRTALREFLAQTESALGTAPLTAARHVEEETIPAPPAGVLLIEYLVANDELLAFAVRRGSDGRPVVEGKAIAVPHRTLRERVNRYLDSIEQRDLRSSESARHLYDLLLSPFESLIRSHRELRIVPAKDLWRVPFHALTSADGRYLIETHEVSYATSMAALEATSPARGRGPATLLALANPNIRAKTQELYRTFYRGKPLGAIPETEHEVRALVSIYGAKNSRVYVGDQARESVLKRESPYFRVLHIAAHGILDEKAPMYSAVALTNDEREDGLLEAREIAELPLQADLAVLSACETGRGLASAEGVLGLSWALLAAGCPNAVVSQWRVDSGSTAELMIAFHRHLVRSGRRSPAESLRRAQLAMMRKYAHPYYWAPFMVIGSGR